MLRQLSLLTLAAAGTSAISFSKEFNENFSDSLREDKLAQTELEDDVFA